MVTTERLYLGFLLAIALERLFELGLSLRNARRAKERGGYEVGSASFLLMAAVHTLFLFACAGEALYLHRPFRAVYGVSALAVALAAQALRYWAITTLGERWNVRIIVVPDALLVTRGPYRFLRHPNYVAVIIEMVAIPLVHGAWATAVFFSAANALLLRHRIATEEHALGPVYERTFRNRPRLVPKLGRAAH
jgi:methyltransferase